MKLFLDCVHCDKSQTEFSNTTKLLTVQSSFYTSNVRVWKQRRRDILSGDVALLKTCMANAYAYDYFVIADFNEST